MLNSFFGSILGETFSIEGYLICTAVSLLLGGLIAFTAGFRSRVSKSMLLALFLIPAVVQTVIMLVNGSIGTGVAVMGAFTLVRFRSVPGNAKEIVSIIIAMAAGLATAMGYVALAVLFVVIFSVAILISGFVKIPEHDDLSRDLKITVPEDLNYAHAFDDIFDEHTRSARLLTVKTTNMGSLFKLIYRIELKNEDNVQELIDGLRCRNGNLEIAVALPAPDGNSL